MVRADLCWRYFAVVDIDGVGKYKASHLLFQNYSISWFAIGW